MNTLVALSDALLGLLPVYGYAVVGMSVFASATGVPLPSSLLLLAAGALASEGVLAFPAIVLAALVAAVAGDCLAYALGRIVGRPLLERAGTRLRVSAAWIASAEQAFNRWGGGAVWITRWLVTAAGPPVSMLAGAEAYPFRLFLTFVVAGEVLWAGGYVGLGWLFGDNWDELLHFVSNISWFAAAAVCAGVLAGVAWRLLRRFARTEAGPPEREASSVQGSQTVPHLT